MAEKEELTPEWGGGKQVVPGEFIWTCYVKSCSFKESAFEGEVKPYMLIGVIVEDPPDGTEEPMNGTEFDFRIYLNPKAAWKCIWFLKKFDYPAELLANENKPIIRRKDVMGMHGKILVKVEQTETGYLNFYANGFDHVGGTELEQKQAKKNGAKATADHTVDSVEVAENPIDLEEDIKNQAPINMDAERPDALDDL